MKAFLRSSYPAKTKCYGLRLKTNIKAGAIVICTPDGVCSTVEGGGPSVAVRRERIT